MKNYIKEKVDKLIKKFKTDDPFELAKLLKIKVVYWPLHEEVNGLYQYEKRVKLIYINSSLSYLMQRVVCAHELGHAILHPKLNRTFLKKYTFFNLNKYENEANKFASELLISDDLVKEYPSYFNLEQISISEGLPIELFKLKYEK
ncbi:ImmA/IrrE family metallo-endopeptidase [Clostridiaceae bacterium UIB06]|uniref:ImmA/IrrE family metallo-endopeptidase n=1 Tax=Clostridium thailandense TaxID=2794346 RepID=A0A949U145_9CLOT|nr:ImmA/IrrE family metallo-endopeptidase [Clostridium thailandense]MBV7275440.1 ImmA/IrrE family metallo-endopeptidase [Clostridium thailandense]MCH5136699.1 ImmA/IrrE family metallo-endopeptidase [Clostridiaceae bacterium UIB06]